MTLINLKMLLRVNSLTNDSRHSSRSKKPTLPGYPIRYLLKFTKISPTRPEDTAKILSWEYRTSHEQQRNYTKAHENNPRKAPTHHNFLYLLSQPGEKGVSNVTGNCKQIIQLQKKPLFASRGASKETSARRLLQNGLFKTER